MSKVLTLMANSNYPRRDKLIEDLSLGNRSCFECNTFSLHLVRRKPALVSCSHCKGEWSIKADKYSLQRERWDNIKPHYLEMP